jgi:hypothetical protein
MIIYLIIHIYIHIHTYIHIYILVDIIYVHYIYNIIHINTDTDVLMYISFSTSTGRHRWLRTDVAS